MNQYIYLKSPYISPKTLTSHWYLKFKNSDRYINFHIYLKKNLKLSNIIKSLENCCMKISKKRNKVKVASISSDERRRKRKLRRRKKLTNVPWSRAQVFIVGEECGRRRSAPVQPERQCLTGVPFHRLTRDPSPVARLFFRPSQKCSKG